MPVAMKNAEELRLKKEKMQKLSKLRRALSPQLDAERSPHNSNHDLRLAIQEWERYESTHRGSKTKRSKDYFDSMVDKEGLMEEEIARLDLEQAWAKRDQQKER